MKPRPGTCSACPQDGRHCAPNRCYCGHPECSAYHSYVDPYKKPLQTQGIDASHHKKSWDNRGESTWLDKL